ncbi:MAG: FtsW/RodA/SpoVE family cell cycle protein [Candidatus Nanopelagicales bacterium]
MSETLQPDATWRDRLVSHPASIYYLLLGSTLFLLLLGLIMVWSSSAIESIRDTGGSTDLVVKQALFAGLGLVSMVVASRLPTATIRGLAWPAMGLALVLLVLVLIPGIGVAVHGQQNWIDLGGPFRLQPSEIAKLALVVVGCRHVDPQVPPHHRLADVADPGRARRWAANVPRHPRR